MEARACQVSGRASTSLCGRDQHDENPTIANGPAPGLQHIRWVLYSGTDPAAYHLEREWETNEGLLYKQRQCYIYFTAPPSI